MVSRTRGGGGGAGLKNSGFFENRSFFPASVELRSAAQRGSHLALQEQPTPASKNIYIAQRYIYFGI